MYDKQKFLRWFFAAVIFCVFPNAEIRASSIPYELFIAKPGKVLLVDGKDRHSKVIIKAKLSSPEWPRFDFGFIRDDLYISMTGKWRDGGIYNKFAGNDIVDFALRNSGTDRLFGTSDDFIYRLSDSANYAAQHYFLPIKSSKSQNPKTAQTYFQVLRLDWDIDVDGNPDAHTFLELKRSKYDGMMPAPTAVPLLPAVWFLGSGVLGFMLMPRRHGACAWEERSR